MNASMQRIAGLGLGFLIIAAASGVQGRAEAAEVRRVSERVIQFAPGGQIRIEDKNGRITVEGWPRHEVRIQITRSVKVEDKAKAEDLMKELRADVEVRDGRIDILSRFPRRRETIAIWDILGRKVASLQINYYVQVPNETNLTVETTNGDVRVHGVRGQVEANTTNGGISAGDVQGGVKLVTTNGEIELTGIAGDATAHTTNGSVVAEVRSVSPRGGIELETTNGNVQTYFPSDLKATVEATTTNGRVSTAYPITSQGVMTSKSIRGTINGGGAKISLATTNGNVEMRRLSERRP